MSSIKAKAKLVVVSFRARIYVEENHQFAETQNKIGALTSTIYIYEGFASDFVDLFVDDHILCTSVLYLLFEHYRFITVL
jgi:hypothetical protein